jgi:hypothetical protein
MSYQSGRQIIVSMKKQAGLGQPASGSDAKVFRANRGMLGLSKQPIQSGENRRDGMMTRGRHGQKEVRGQYIADLSLGTFDHLFEAVMRSTFAADLVITEATASLTSITTTTSTIVDGGGSWITAGLRVGDVIRLTGHSSAGNNSRNLRITGLTTSTITVAETLTANAVADTAFTITRPRTLVQGLDESYWTVEEYETIIDASELFTDVKVGSMLLELQPNGMALLTFGLIGLDMEAKTAGDAPVFTSPVATTSIGLTSVEAKILLGGAEVADLTAARLSFDLRAQTVPVVGATKSPDVFTNLSLVEGSITALRQDLSRVSNFLNEDQLSLALMFCENESEPKDFVSFFLGNLTLSNAAKSELGQDGPRTQELPIMVGVDERGGAYSQTMLKIATSAAA